MDRRTFLRAGAAGFASVGATAYVAGGVGSWDGSSAAVSPVTEGPAVRLEEVVSGFREPIALVFPPDEEDVRLVADKYGTVYRHDADGLASEPFLDLSDSLAEFGSWEQGLLGFTLHPEYEETRTCYVRYSAPPKVDSDSHTFVLSEFEVDADGRRADPDSERILLSIREPDSDHNSGAIVFGPDGYLYVGVGDGGKYNDAGKGHADDWYWLNKGGNGQDLTDNLMGSLLRIDVDGRGDGRPYAVPDDNPLVGREGLDEQWAWGFRNPFRLSFAPDGRLFVTDVGDERFEEINVVEAAGNYGWNVREGESCFANRLPMLALGKLPGFESAYPACPTETPDGNPLRDPVVTYPHVKDGEHFGYAVIGGFVCDDPALPELAGEYVFGDFMGTGAGGRLFATSEPEGDEELWPMAELSVPDARGPGVGSILLSFAEGPGGELYALTSQMSKGTGTVSRILPAE